MAKTKNITFQDLWKLNESFPDETKNFHKTRFLVETKLETNITLHDGSTLTMDLLYQKYKDYSIHWQRTIGSRGEKFIGKDDKLLCLYDYVDKNMYESGQREIPIEADPRYEIIFGGVPEELIRERFILFRKEVE